MSTMFAPRSGNTSFYEFKAGRCKMEAGSSPTKKKIVAEKEKGLVYVMAKEGLTHFCWKNRETKAVVEDFTVMPTDVEFKAVNGCPDGQVFMLKFKQTNTHHLYWAQDGNADRDSVVKEVNKALNRTAAVSDVRMGARGGPTDQLSSRGRRTSRAGAADQLDHNDEALRQLVQMLGPNINNRDVQESLQSWNNMLNREDSGANDSADQGYSGAEMGSSTGNEGSSTGNELPATPAAVQNARHVRVEVDLAQVATGRRVSETAKANSACLEPHTPQNEPNTPAEEVLATIHSPVYQQVVSSFGHALQTGQMGPVLQQFNFPADVIQAAFSGDILEFSKRLESAEKSKEVPKEEQMPEDPIEEPKEPEPKRGKPDDESMDLE